MFDGPAVRRSALRCIYNFCALVFFGGVLVVVDWSFETKLDTERIEGVFDANSERQDMMLFCRSDRTKSGTQMDAKQIKTKDSRHFAEEAQLFIVSG